MDAGKSDVLADAVTAVVRELGAPAGVRQTVCGPYASHPGVVLVFSDRNVGLLEAETCTAAFAAADVPTGGSAREFVQTVKRRLAAAMTRWRKVGLVADGALDEAIKLSLAD